MAPHQDTSCCLSGCGHGLAADSCLHHPSAVPLLDLLESGGQHAAGLHACKTGDPACSPWPPTSRQPFCAGDSAFPARQPRSPEQSSPTLGTSCCVLEVHALPSSMQTLPDLGHHLPARDSAPGVLPLPDRLPVLVQALQIFGTNFQLVTQRLNSRMKLRGWTGRERERREVKRKFTREEKENPSKVDRALTGQVGELEATLGSVSCCEGRLSFRCLIEESTGGWPPWEGKAADRARHCCWGGNAALPSHVQLLAAHAGARRRSIWPRWTRRWRARWGVGGVALVLLGCLLVLHTAVRL